MIEKLPQQIEVKALYDHLLWQKLNEIIDVVNRREDWSALEHKWIDDENRARTAKPQCDHKWEKTECDKEGYVTRIQCSICGCDKEE